MVSVCIFERSLKVEEPEFCRRKENLNQQLFWVDIEEGKISQSSAQEVRFTARAEVSLNGCCAVYVLDLHYNLAHNLRTLIENSTSRFKYIFEMSIMA